MKKTISLILCIAMILSTVAFAMPAFAVDLDFDVEASEDFAQATETPEATLSGTKGDDDGKPGINVLTGTKDIYGFEDAGFYHPALQSSRDNAIIADPDDATNTVMWVGDAAYSNIGITPIPDSVNDKFYPLALGKTWENERPFTLNFDLKGTPDSTHKLAFMSGLDNGKINDGPGWITIATFAIEDGMNWKPQTAKFTYAQAIQSTKMFVCCFYNQGMPTGTDFYIDNVEIIPDYRVRYFAPDGKTVVKTDYVDGKATTFSLNEDVAALYAGNDKFLGFKFVGAEDTDLIEGEITLANEDIDLIAAVDSDIIAPDYIKAVAGTKVTVSAKYAGTWSVDDETLATIEGNGDEAVITTTGYTGTLGITIVSEDESATDTVYVRLRRPSKVKPGKNMFTGTEEAFGFEETAEENVLSIQFGRNTRLAANPNANGNESKYVAEGYHAGGSGQNFPQFLFDQFQFGGLIDFERPVLLSFDWMGQYDNIWLLGDNGNATLTSAAANNGAKKSAEWHHVDYAWTQKTKHKFCMQLGKNSGEQSFYMDNISLVPYFKVSFADATGAVTGYEYVSPLEDKYVIPEDKIAALDADKYAGYKLEGTDALVTEVALTDSDIVLVPATKEGVEVVAPVSVTGHGGITEGIDPKYPGAYYTFDEPLDVDTLTIDELKNIWADSFVYDEETNTLIVFSKTKRIVGHSEYFKGYDSNIKTESGKYVVFPKTATLAYGTKVVNDGANMIPYGDFETAYNPFYTDDKTIDLSVVDGKLYATANTEESSYPHTAFQTVVEAGATYQVYAETKAIDVETAEPGINIVFEGDSEGGLVNHASVNNYHVTNNSIATIEKVDGTLYFDAEFVVSALDNDAETAIAQVAIYSSPVDGKTVGYTIDNYELYRRTDVKYVPNDAVVSEGIEVPVDGAYLTLKGNVANDEAIVVAADYFFPAIDDKRYVDGWVSLTDGITYAAGEEINLAEVELDENGEYPLTPVVVAKEGFEFVNITFEETDLVTKTPSDIEGIYMTEDVLPMAQFYSDDLTSKVSGKRFLGWSVDGTKAGIVQPEDSITLEKDIHFTPIVGYDFNFALKESQSGWSWNVGSVVFEDTLLKTVRRSGAGGDCYLTRNGLGIPGSEIHKIIYWFAEDYTAYADAQNTGAKTQKFAIGSTLQDGLFYMQGSQGAAESRKYWNTATTSVTAPDGRVYYGFEADVTTNANWDITALLNGLRLDAFSGNYDFSLRYVEFRDYEAYDAEELVIDMAAPEVGVAPDADPAIDDIAVIDSIEWTPALSAGGNFKALTAYTAQIVLKPADKLMRFNPEMPIIVGGYEAEFVEEDAITGATTVKVEFPATEDYVPFDFDLTTVPEEIVVDKVEDVQLVANITETTAGIDESIVWTIEEGDNAAITTDGLLSVFDEGTITVRAISAYNENKTYTKDIVITLTDAVKPVVITFEGDIKEVPAAITRLAGDVVDLAEYLDMKSSVAGKNFNGWTLDGAVLTDEIIVPEEDITLTAAVNYDLNMAIAANAEGWSYSGGEYYENDMLVLRNDNNTSHDVILEKLSGFAVPTAEVGKIRVYVDRNYVKNGVESKFAVGDSGSGIFFVRDIDSAASGDRFVAGKVVEIVDDFAVIEMNMTENANWNHNIKGIRFDVGTGLYDFSVRYIEYIEKDAYDYDVIEIEGLDVPATGYDLDTTVEDAADLVDVLSVVWTPDEFIKYNYDGTDYVKFDAEKTYTATITARIPLGANKKFAEGTIALVNGEEATLTENADGTVTIAYTFEKTAPYEEFSMEITGPEVISKEGRTTQYRLAIDGDIPVKTASWAVEEGFESYAIINETNGKLTPVRNIDELKIIATSHYNSAIKAEFIVKLENQAAEAVVTYDANTTATVTNMPDPTAGAGRIKLSEEVPVRDGYICIGWSESAESRTVVDAVATEGENVTVYAVWEKVQLAFEFNNSWSGFSNSVGHGSGVPRDTYLELNSTTYDLRITTATALTLNPKRSSKATVRMSTNCDSNESANIYFWVPGQSNIEAGNTSASVVSGSHSLDDWKIVEIPFTDPDWAKSDNIPKFALDPINKAESTVYIDYIRFYDEYRDITFNANAGSDTVEGMPADGMTKVGETLKIVEQPTRAGYEFLGWAKTANATETATEFYVGDDMTVYAIWVKAIEVVDPSIVDLGATTEEAVVVTTLPEAVVTVTVTTADGEQTLTATADANGLAVIDLTQVEGDITAATATSNSDIEKVVLTDKETADALVEAAGTEVEGETNVIIKVDGVDQDGDSNDGPKKWDTTVENVKNENDSYKPTGKIPTINDTSESEDGGEVVDVKALMSESGEILLNFNSKSEADFFPTASLRQFTLNGVSDSVISFTNKGKAAGSNDSPALFSTSFALDAATHPYIVMKIRNTTDSSCRIYFRTSEAGFAEARALTKAVASDYSMVVYDMSSIADWKGSVTGLFFSFGATAGEIVEIDWLMFTDTLPENMEAIEGTKELFPIVNKGAMPFEDVKSDDWFHGEVSSAYRLGFVEGQSEKVYNPQGNVTVAEVITLAVRLNYSYNGKALPEVAEGAEWYSNYVNAAVREGIIKNTQFADYNAPALRKEVAQIMNKALPTDYLKAINMFTSIPDVPTKDPAYGAIRKLYNAGILMGMDGAFNFYPNNNVTRAEIAAVVNRMALPANRKRVVTEAELESRRKYYYAEDLEAAALGNCYETKLKIKGDFAYATGKSGDPIVYLVNVVGQLNGKELTKITVALKWDETKIKANPVMFFTTPSGGWAAGRMLSSKNTGEKTENGSTIFTLDPKSNGQFADTITAIRFDPFDAKDIEFAIEYIIIE